MSQPLVHSLDHLVLRVQDLEVATGSYRRLFGREPSWRGEHPQWGTSNSLFRLDNTYVELLRVPEGGDGPFSRRPDDADEGPMMLSFGTDDAERLRRVTEAKGLRPSAPQLGQGTNLVDGAVRRWKNVFFPRDTTHGARLFAIEHLSPPEALPPAPLIAAEVDAAVGAVDHVVVRTRDGDRARALYGDTLGIRLALDRSFPEWKARLLFFRLGHLTLEIAAPVGGDFDSGAVDSETAVPDADDHFWGVSYRVGDADRARERLDAEGFETSEVRDGRKPGTRVFRVRSGTHGVPTLMLEPPADLRGSVAQTA